MQNHKLRQSFQEMKEAFVKLAQEVAELRVVVARHGQVVTGLVSLAGSESVSNEITRLHQEEQDRTQRAIEANAKSLVDAGVLKPTDTIGPNTYVQGYDKLPDGRIKITQIETDQIPPEAHQFFFGKKVGEEIAGEIPFVITAVYEVDQVASLEYQRKMSEKAKAAAEASKTPPVNADEKSSQ